MIGKEDIEKLATLSRLKLTEEEKSGFKKDINNILEYVGQISDVASEGVRREVGDVRNVMRADENPIKPGTHTEEILNEAPRRGGDYLEVRKIL